MYEAFLVLQGIRKILRVTRDIGRDSLRVTRDIGRDNTNTESN
jgi:hypothetical protein